MPQTYAQARASSDWPQIKAAMHEEIEKLERYGVWEVVDLQKGMSVLDARFRQVEGLHSDELHAAVAHKDTIRVFLSLVNRFDLQVDIVSAFLNGELQETIYVHPPELSNVPNSKVLLLKKSLYGLRQSPRCFNKKFDSWLAAKADPLIYTETDLINYRVYFAT